ncbi:helix-turn-helix transcriptional regulator [Mycoplasmatota bacterium]|nr:helix-turn-helix transcriptional regulator [Mycoplasmatota bacterium]
MLEKKVLKTLEEIKAFSDPYRLSILTTYRNFNRPATVKEIADKLHEVPAKIHYHVKKLEKVEILKLAYTKEINGIIAKYYELTANSYAIHYSENNKELNQIILNEAQRLVENQYENSKQIILNEIANIDPLSLTENNDSDSSDIEIVNQNLVYLTEEDIQELKTILERLGKNKKAKENTKKYHLFSVLYLLSENE